MNIGYVNVSVTDLEASIAFYRDTLGLNLLMSEEAFGYASFAAGPITLGLAVSAADAGGHTGIGFVVDDLLARHAELQAAGVRFTMAPERQPWGGFMALFADPDGNIYYLDEVSAVHS